MRNKNTLLIVGIILLVLLVGAAAYAFRGSAGNAGGNSQNNSSSTAENSAPAAIKSFTVAKPNFLIKGDNLSKVEIWAVPTGTGIKPENYSLIANATKQSGEGLNETWTAPLPKKELLVTEIFARGYNLKGELVAKMSLPYTGATEIYNAIWK